MPEELVFTTAEFQSRLATLRSVLEDANCEACVAFANKVLPGHVRYYSGYETRHGIHDCSYLYYCPSQGRCVLLSNASWDDPRTRTWLDEVIVTSDFGNSIADLLPRTVHSVGIAGWNSFPLPTYLAVTRARPDVEVRDISQSVVRARMVKSNAEVAILTKCAEITDAGGRAFLESARPGRSEREVVVEMESAMKLAGSEEVSFSTQIGTGEATARIGAYPTDHRIQTGELVQMDCGATFHGYRGDLSRIALTGEAHPEVQKLMGTAAEIYDACLQMLKPGVAVSEVLRRGLEIAASRNLLGCLYHSPNCPADFLGHGIGCHYDEPPSLAATDPAILEENMVIVLEPILTRAGTGGVKIEDAVLVSAKGPVRMSKLPIRTWEFN